LPVSFVSCRGSSGNVGEDCQTDSGSFFFFFFFFLQKKITPQHSGLSERGFVWQGMSGEKDLKELHDFLKKQEGFGKSAKEVDAALSQLDPKRKLMCLLFFSFLFFSFLFFFFFFFFFFFLFFCLCFVLTGAESARSGDGVFSAGAVLVLVRGGRAGVFAALSESVCAGQRGAAAPGAQALCSRRPPLCPRRHRAPGAVMRLMCLMMMRD
jgi:hypothetical protein